MGVTVDFKIKPQGKNKNVSRVKIADQRALGKHNLQT
jgi:hypothetical protein